MGFDYKQPDGKLCRLSKAGGDGTMTPDTVINIGQQALHVTVLLAAPMLLSVLAVGLIIGMFQAATQINEMTLSFIPKLIVLALALMLSGSWMMDVALGFMRQIFEGIPDLIG